VARAWIKEARSWETNGCRANEPSRGRSPHHVPASTTLPDLPYDYSALEPHYSAQILELHHDKHHAAYVKGLNDTMDQLAEARDKGDFSSIVGLEKSHAFNLSGHVLHSILLDQPVARGRREARR
jgi:hypothetical protein